MMSKLIRHSCFSRAKSFQMYLTPEPKFLFVDLQSFSLDYLFLHDMIQCWKMLYYQNNYRSLEQLQFIIMIIHRHNHTSDHILQANYRQHDEQRPVISQSSTYYSNFFNPSRKSLITKRMSSTHQQQENYTSNSFVQRRSLTKRQNLQEKESQMVNYILIDVKSKYKEIHRQKSKVGRDKNIKIQSQGGQKKDRKKDLAKTFQNFRESFKVAKKELISQNMNMNLKNKKLIHLKKGRLLKSTQRNHYNQKIMRRLERNSPLKQDAPLQNKANFIKLNIDDEEGQQDYLKSQNIIKFKLKYNKDVTSHYKTQSPPFERYNSKSFSNYDSDVFYNHVLTDKAEINRF